MHPLHSHPSNRPQSMGEDSFAYSVGQFIDTSYRYGHSQSATGVDRRAYSTTYEYQMDAHRRRPKYTRSKTGCLTCRQKKVKCDESKPSCIRCMHGQRVCTWPVNVPQRKRSPKKGELLDACDGRPSTSSSNGLSEASSTPPRSLESPPHAESDSIRLLPPLSPPRRHSEPLLDTYQQQVPITHRRHTGANVGFQCHYDSTVSPTQQEYPAHSRAPGVIPAYQGFAMPRTPQPTATSRGPILATLPRSSGLVSASPTPTLAPIVETSSAPPTYDTLPSSVPGSSNTDPHGRSIYNLLNAPSHISPSVDTRSQVQYEGSTSHSSLSIAASRDNFGYQTPSPDSSSTWHNTQSASAPATTHMHSYVQYYAGRHSTPAAVYGNHLVSQYHRYDQNDYTNNPQGYQYNNPSSISLQSHPTSQRYHMH